MYLVLLKIKDKVYFESLENQQEMIEFIESIESKFGSIEYPKSVIVQGNDSDINFIIEKIEEQFYFYIVGRKLDEKVYKDLMTLINDSGLDLQITIGIEFDTVEVELDEEELDDSDNIDSNTITLTTETLSDIIEYIESAYNIYFYICSYQIYISLVEIDDIVFEKSKSFFQTFNNLDETMALFEGFKNDFMEIIDSENEDYFTISSHLDIIPEFIESKLLSMSWKDVEPIKYFNGRYKQNDTTINDIVLTDDEYLTAREVMKKLKISDQTIANWRRNNLIEFKKISNRKYLYPTASVMEIFEYGIDTTRVNNTTVSKSKVSDTISNKSVNYKDEVIKILKPLSYKVPEHKLQSQNFFLNFGNIGMVSSPQVMINNDFQLVDFIKKKVIKSDAKELYEYLKSIFDDRKEPKIDTSKKQYPEYSKFYLKSLFNL